MEIETLRELVWKMNIARRFEKAEINPGKSFRLHEIRDQDEHDDFLNIHPNSISDEDLFE